MAGHLLVEGGVYCWGVTTLIYFVGRFDAGTIAFVRMETVCKDCTCLFVDTKDEIV